MNAIKVGGYMSVPSSGETPFIPKSHKTQSKSTKAKSPKDKAVSDLKHKIHGDAEVSKKSTKAEKERKTFEQEAKDLGYKFNTSLGQYQSIQDSEKLMSIAEMESLVANSHDLLPEVFGHILSFVPRNDWATVKAVSKNWERKTLEAVKKEQVALLKSYGKFLDENLSDRELAKQINGIIFDSKISESKNLVEVRSILLDLREKIVCLLKDVDSNHLSILKNRIYGKEVPRFFKALIPLAFISSEKIEWKRGSTLIYLPEQLDDSEIFEVALKVANSLTDDYKNPVLNTFSVKLIDMQQFDRALEVINMMSPDGIKNSAVEKYSNTLIQACMDDFKKGKIRLEDLRKACDVLKTLYRWIIALDFEYHKEIFSLVILMDQTDLARMLANAITNPHKKENALKIIEDLLRDKSVLTSKLSP